jgi:prefoldin subunit 5
VAQPSNIKVRVDADMVPLRRKIKAIRSLAQDADRELAQLEERWAQLEAKLAEYGIRFKLEEETT